MVVLRVILNPWARPSASLILAGWLAGWLLAGSDSSQDSVCLRFAAESENLRSSAWRIHQQIVIGACCCRSGQRDYEIKLGRRISGARESLQFYFSAKQEHSSRLKQRADFLRILLS
jgi:hypothetical protein